MCTEHRGERTELEPAHIEFLIRGIIEAAGKIKAGDESADVAVPIWYTGHREVNAGSDLDFEIIPACERIA